MQLIADVLLAAGAFGAALYCFVLSRRLTRFATLETGMGGAIAVLSAQVDDLTRALAEAQAAAQESAAKLGALNTRAEAGAQKLELMLAALHDLPEPAAARPAPPPHAPPPHAPPPQREEVARMRLRRRRAQADAATADTGGTGGTGEARQDAEHDA
jgi:hypothetical protein